jgi:16S rRNA (guanine527-N7)-methyltransferase
VNAAFHNLAAAMAEQQIRLPDQQVALLEQYCRLLWDWNTKLNLTRHTDYRKFVARDLVDSLTFAEFLQPGEVVLDVGTGGGVPGIVLAIVRPDLSVSMCESVGKKARAVADMVDRLGLDVPVYDVRAEDVLGRSRYNTLVARAVARLVKLLGWLRPHWGAFDRLLVLKGPAWVEERGEARHRGLLRNLALRKLAACALPGSEAESVLLQICPKDRMLDRNRCRMTELHASRGRKVRRRGRPRR